MSEIKPRASDRSASRSRSTATAGFASVRPSLWVMPIGLLGFVGYALLLR